MEKLLYLWAVNDNGMSSPDRKHLSPARSRLSADRHWEGKKQQIVSSGSENNSPLSDIITSPLKHVFSCWLFFSTFVSSVASIDFH